MILMHWIYPYPPFGGDSPFRWITLQLPFLWLNSQTHIPRIPRPHSVDGVAIVFLDDPFYSCYSWPILITIEHGPVEIVALPSLPSYKIVIFHIFPPFFLCLPGGFPSDAAPPVPPVAPGFSSRSQHLGLRHEPSTSLREDLGRAMALRHDLCRWDQTPLGTWEKYHYLIIFNSVIFAIWQCVKTLYPWWTSK